MITTSFKFSKNIPQDALVIDVTSNSGEWRDLSPFVLPAPPARVFENLWQFSKVYAIHLGKDGLPTPEWFRWRDKGFADPRPHRYPMGKGAIPAYSFWNGEELTYIDARKQIYIPEYKKNVIRTDAFKKLQKLYKSGRDIVLLDYDAYDYKAMGKTLKNVVHDPTRKMGHAFVLIMMLERERSFNVRLR
ncbi:MAG: hypothetical protein ABSG90_13395 [Dehalococcoidia bacterium]|jgi:hypothetical protein